jgi:predicted permease
MDLKLWLILVMVVWILLTWCISYLACRKAIEDDRKERS